MMKDGKRERAFLCRVVREAWEKCGGRPSVTDVKSAFDLVTDIDFAMEKFITRAIGEEFPGDAVIGEEYNPLTELPAGRCWTVDPVDGTVNFARGLPLFGVQCAFCEDGIPLASAIYLPAFGELYSASAGAGARLNGEPIFVSSRREDMAVASVGDYSHRSAELFEMQLGMTRSAAARVAKVRHFGAASVDFSWLAAGRTDAFVMLTRNLWDIVPGMLLVKEAGGVVRSADGGEFVFGGRGIVAAASEEIADIFCARVREEV